MTKYFDFSQYIYLLSSGSMVNAMFLLILSPGHEGITMSVKGNMTNPGFVRLKGL